MRLINTATLQLEEVADSELSHDKNQYAILSHRWGSNEDEVSYQEMTSDKDISQKKGYVKIREFCSIALQSGYRYGWCDTCCINKGNSSELAESINSMFMWYKMSSLCVVYLADVPTVQFEDSEWFTRGWTLQELIAPRTLSFYNGHWEFVGTKLNLLGILSSKTCVPSNVLGNLVEPYTCSVAQRMSWAAHRVTQRVEDRAYSLLGLFEINMPMIYGEREKSFLRLQQNIARQSKDESLFAWTLDASKDSVDYSSIFATTPSAFWQCRNTISTPGSTGFTEANGELAITLEVHRRSPGIFDALLHCTEEDRPYKKFFISISKTFGSETYVRVRNLQDLIQGLVSENPGKENRRLLHFVIEPKTPPVTIIYGFWLRTLRLPGREASDMSIVSNSPPLESGYIQKTSNGDAGMVQLQPKDQSVLMHWSRIRWLVFWFNASYNPVVWLGNDTQTAKLQSSFDALIATDQSDAKTRIGIFHSLDKTFIETPEGKKIRTFEARDVGHDWPHGNAIITVDRKKGLYEYVLPNLHLQVSLRLQPCPSPNVKHNPMSPRNTTLIWTVDITTVNAPAWPTKPLPTNWSQWAQNIACCPCVLNCQVPCLLPCLIPCWLLCVEHPPIKSRFNLTCYDFLYPWCGGRWLRKKTARVKREFAKMARETVPMLKPGGDTMYAFTSIRPLFHVHRDCLEGWPHMEEWQT